MQTMQAIVYFCNCVLIVKLEDLVNYNGKDHGSHISSINLKEGKNCYQKKL